MALNFPDPATQTPVNTWSPTSTPSASTNGLTYLWDGTKWGTTGGPDVHVLKAGDTMTGNLTVPSLNGGPLAGLRNVLINGDFRIWQRGTSFTSGGYTADRWSASGSGGSTRTVSQYEDIETTGMQVIFASGGSANSRTMIQQKIEDVRTFAGQEVTLSFEARSTNITQISTDVQQFFGSGGSPSTTTTFGGKKHTGLENSWKKFSVTFTVPSVDGKTIGSTNALDCLQVNFFLEAGSDFDGRTDSLGIQSGNIILRNVQLEPGPVATPFEHRPISAEKALCQRYYETSSNVVFLQNTGTTSHIASAAANVWFKVTKRATPTIVISGGENVSSLTALSFPEGAATSFVATGTATNSSASARFKFFSADAEL